MAPVLIVHDKLKIKIREELEKIDRWPDEPALDRLVAGLPIEVVTDLGGIGQVRRPGAWTEKIQTPLVKALKDGLKKTDMDLTEQEIDDLVARCLPKPASEPNPDRPSSP